MIQDYIFAVGSVVFFISLLPMLISKKRPPLLTSIPTGAILAVFSVTYATLDLPFSCVTTGLAAGAWLLTGILTVLDNHSTVCYDSSIDLTNQRSI